MFKFPMHFELFRGEVWTQFYHFSDMYPVVPKPFTTRPYFLQNLWWPLPSATFPRVHGYISGLSFLFTLVLSTYQQHCFNYCLCHLSSTSPCGPSPLFLHSALSPGSWQKEPKPLPCLCFTVEFGHRGALVEMWRRESKVKVFILLAPSCRVSSICQCPLTEVHQSSQGIPLCSSPF